MRANLRSPISLVLLILASASPALGDVQWRSRAHIDVEKPATVEAIMPPELITVSDNQLMDLTLVGPDQQPKPFEIYWREPVGEIRQALSPSKVQLDENHHFIWEADMPDKTALRRLIVELAAPDHIGKIDVEGFIREEWILLASNAAVYNTDGLLRANIDIRKAPYEKLRLRLRSYDQHIRNALSPIKTVEVVGDRIGKDYHLQELPIAFKQSHPKNRIIADAVLPGDGLWITALSIQTGAQFEGPWRIGRQAITDGRKTLLPDQSGQARNVHVLQRILDIDIDKQWSGRSLVVELDSREGRSNKVGSVTATVRLPRIVFLAESAGRYTVLGNSGEYAAIREHPSDQYGQTSKSLAFSQPEINPDWRLASLVEKYHLKGGPFDPQGYTWQAPVSITKPGYYRLELDRDASLNAPPSTLRIVKDGNQVPFILGWLEEQSIWPPAASTYDQTKNLTRWDIHLPVASPNWRTLSLQSRGLFDRRIEFQYRKPGNMGWQTWSKGTWVNRKLQETAYKVDLSAMPGEIETIRVVMHHGDNQPVEIDKTLVFYDAPTLCFLAHEPGTYVLFGGNKTSPPPRYDLALVQDELMATLPDEARMGKLEPLSGPGLYRKICETFTDTGWGLYAILGGVSLVLLIIIVRLFPKPADQEA